MRKDKGQVTKSEFKPEEGLKRAFEWRTMAGLAKKAGNQQMAEDCLDNAYLEELRVEQLKNGRIVFMIAVIA